MFAQFRLYLAGAAAVLVLGLGMTVYLQGLRIDKLRAENRTLAVERNVCVDANKAGQDAISALQRDISRGMQSCAKQTETKDATIARLREIIGTGGNNAHISDNAKDQVVGVGVAHPDGDPVLKLLVGMLPGPVDGSEAGVHPPAGAPAGAGAGLPAGEMVPRPSGGEGWGEGRYCLDEVNAKRLAANVAMLRGWALGMQSILASYQTATP